MYAQRTMYAFVKDAYTPINDKYSVEIFRTNSFTNKIPYFPQTPGSDAESQWG